MRHVYTAANIYLSRRGARHRKRSGHTAGAKQPSDDGGGKAIAIGALLDGMPESIVIEVTMIREGAVSLVAVMAIYLSEIPEGLSSAAGMKRAGRSTVYVVGLWTAIAIASAIASIVGYAVFARFSADVIAGTRSRIVSLAELGCAILVRAPLRRGAKTMPVLPFAFFGELDQ